MGQGRGRRVNTMPWRFGTPWRPEEYERCARCTRPRRCRSRSRCMPRTAKVLAGPGGGADAAVTSSMVWSPHCSFAGAALLFQGLAGERYGATMAKNPDATWTLWLLPAVGAAPVGVRRARWRVGRAGPLSVSRGTWAYVTDWRPGALSPAPPPSSETIRRVLQRKRPAGHGTRARLAPRVARAGVPRTPRLSTPL